MAASTNCFFRRPSHTSRAWDNVWLKARRHISPSFYAGPSQSNLPTGRPNSANFSTSASSDLAGDFSCCVVGAGPAGFYTAEKILKSEKCARVDILDRLPAPFGLVRSGVAPDHPETKAVINQFSRVASGERCNFFGNVKLGQDISIDELRQRYHAVILAYGAESDRRLGIPGEELGGVLSAREFVWWYNGHPDYRNLPVDLTSTDTAIVLGQGNVALDCARVLMRNVDELAKTDIAEHALSALRESRIRRVLLVGRRGPAQAACTAKETRELLGLKDVAVNVRVEDLTTTEADKEEMKKSRSHRRVFELLSRAAKEGSPPGTSAQRHIDFVFFRQPVQLLPAADRNSVAAVRLEKTILQSTPDGGQRASGTGEFENLAGGLVLRSIGYKSIPVPGVPFDNRKGVIPNSLGRVLASPRGGDSTAQHAEVDPGLYTVGWLKRGPTGIIGTNLACAEETVASVLEDKSRNLLTGLKVGGAEGLKALLEDRGVQVVTFDSWKRIDEEEVQRGALTGKPREKMVDIADMLRVARSGS